VQNIDTLHHVIKNRKSINKATKIEYKQSTDMLEVVQGSNSLVIAIHNIYCFDNTYDKKVIFIN